MDYSSDEDNVEDITPDELEELEYTFKEFAFFMNKNEGVITENDLEHTLKSIGLSLTEAEIFKILDEFNPNHKGIDFKTFLLIVKANLKPLTAEDLKLSFSVFDKDGNGHIATQEIRLITSQLGHKYTNEEIEDMLKEGDIDGDGRISFDDFVYFMTRR